MFAVTYLVRVLPLVVFQEEDSPNRFVRSFLTYSSICEDCLQR
ncbi:MAG: AzlD domain-containing protein [Lachnospiraceae bacterium]